MRLFFALWPDAEVRKQINKVKNLAARQQRGRSMQAGNLHLTLAFLGSVSEEQYECVLERAGQIEFTPFTITLDHIGGFNRAKVVWLGLQEKPFALMQLAAQLHEQATDCGISVDDKPYNPHVTLMRKVDRPQSLVIEPIYWQVDHFCLMQSVTLQEGVQYKVINSWC